MQQSNSNPKNFCLYIILLISILLVWMTDSKSPIDKSTEDIHIREKISERLIQEIRKTREQIDIGIKITNNPSISFTIEILVNTIKRN